MGEYKMSGSEEKVSNNEVEGTPSSENKTIECADKENKLVEVNIPEDKIENKESMKTGEKENTGSDKDEAMQMENNDKNVTASISNESNEKTESSKKRKSTEIDNKEKNYEKESLKSEAEGEENKKICTESVAIPQQQNKE